MSDQRHEDHGANGPIDPRVIDLEAEEIKPGAQAAPETAPPFGGRLPPPADQPPAPARQGGTGAAIWILAALTLGAVGGGWFYRDVLWRYLPSDGMAALQTRIAALETQTSGLPAEIAAAASATGEASAAAAVAQDQARQASDTASAAGAAVAGLGQRLDQLEQRLASAEGSLATARGDLDGLRASLSATPAAGSAGTDAGASPIGQAALAALGQRIDALEKDMASLRAATGANPKAGVAAALTQALSDLKAKVAVGAAYGEEYDRLARMVPAAAGLDTVAAHAVEGLPAAAGLAAELRAAIPALPRPAPAQDGGDGYAALLMKTLSGIVTIRDIGETDWPAVAEKTASLAEAGDLPQAIAAIEKAEGDKPAALSAWRERAAARLALEAALAQVSESVLRQIAALGGGGTP